MNNPNEEKASRIDRWTQKLLDFSARNRLLNIPKSSRHVVQLKCDDIAALEDKVAANEPIAVCADMPPKDLARRLNDLYHDARTAVEESGSNPLFVAIGALQWTDAASRKSYLAPILLLPARLERASMAAGVKLYRRDEDTSLNSTLIEFLRSQFGIVPQGLDPLPADDSGVDVAKVLESFREAVAGREGFAVFEGAWLGCFSFAKFVMWKDISARADELKKSPLVSHLLGGGGVFDDGVEVFPPEEVSRHLRPGELFCPVSYDSSQLTAVLYSALGKTFVLHGPPGTGKSQTITNIIAHNLAIGRRVLFVSEKKAALDVVKSRLDRIGLSPFCLELHSNKTEKARFYAQIKEALDVPPTGFPGEWPRVVEDFAARRAELDEYVAALHRAHPCGLTAYDCFASKMAGGEVAPVAAECLAMPLRAREDLRAAVSDMAADWAATTAEAVDALAPLADFEWNPAAERETRDAAAALSAAIGRDGFAFVPKGEDGAAAALDAAAMREAAERTDRLARRPKLLRWIFAFFEGRGRAKAGAELAAALDGAAAAMGESRGVMRYRASSRVVREGAGGAFVAAVEAASPTSADAAGLFDRSFAAKALDEVLAAEPALAGFAGLRRDEQIREFRRLDARCTSLAKKMVFAKLAAALPRRRGGPCPEGTELGMLKRECEKKTRQKAVRAMLAESRTLMPVLKPCFLMSPLSVAQYLPVDAEPFDLVVFDEASQIPVWDAIGVIARGRQLIVVGDPKQMPPTSFFQKGDADGDDVDDDDFVIEDQESILDECLVAGVHSTYLNWHYRSRHESLIAFSNEHYYDSRLCTFPAAADTPRLGVKFMFVEGGRFAKAGKGPRVNEVEARALVDYVCSEVKKPGYKPRSIGVVTFSMTQQKLVRTMFDERRAADHEIEKALPEEGDGAFFVKNLENVQGDESDVILFSVGYAPDENGRFTMNFGPLNMSGGERRLNVAVTRAKQQVVVFSSIHGSQIDAGEDGRTKAVGAAHLKAFLEYAERGGAAHSSGGGRGRRGLGDAVAAFLESKGLEVDRDVGVSSLRVDVAVRDPEKPGAYLLGVECDGPLYAAQRTAQDRDLNRDGVLNGLGWHMCRVWSADWALDRARAEARLLEAVERAKTEPPVKPAEPEPEDAVSPCAAAPDAADARLGGHPEYVAWSCGRSRPRGDIHDPSAKAQTERMLRAAVETEGPVFESVLRRRVAKAWGVTRMTEGIQRIIDGCMPRSLYVVTEHKGGRVYWPTGVSPATWRDYRVASRDPEAQRTVDEVPPEELANAMREVQADFGRCPKDDLYREALRALGLGALTAKARALLDAAAK